MTNSVQITEKKIAKSRYDGPARRQFLIQEVAYSDTGRAYPFIIEVLECHPRQAQGLRAHLEVKYQSRVVDTLDLKPLVASLF
jgi:hypothetical protein